MSPLEDSPKLLWPPIRTVLSPLFQRASRATTVVVGCTVEASALSLTCSPALAGPRLQA